MRYLTFILLIIPCLCAAQEHSASSFSNAASSNNGNNSQSGKVNGYIEIPALMKLHVAETNLNQFPIRFSTIEEYNKGKTVNNVAGLTVKSSRPWIVTVMTHQPFAQLQSSGGITSAVPTSIFSIKESNSEKFTPIVNSPQTFLISSNNDIVNNYTVDMQISPKYGCQSGVYSTNIIFTLTQQ